MNKFIGTINFIKNHISQWAILIQLLAILTKKGIKFKLGECKQQDFEALKAEVTKAIILAYFDISNTIHICTNASEYAFGAVLYQVHDGCLQVEDPLF